MNKFNFDDCISSTRFLMKCIGTWPGTKSNTDWYSRCHFLVAVFFMLFFINIPQTRMLLLAWGNLNDVIEILTVVNIIVSLTVLKSITIWYNKQDLRYLLLEIREDWKNAEMTKKEILWKNAELGKLIITFLIILGAISVVACALLSLATLKAHVSQINTIINVTEPRPMFLISKFFFETDYSPVFEIIWIFQLLSIAITAVAYISSEGFLLFSILHACSQFRNLQLDLKNLTYNLKNSKFSVVERSIIKRHIQLKRFTNIIEEKFNKVFLVQMISCSVTICLQSYQLVIILTEHNKRSASNIIFIIFFTMTTILSIFVYCLIAEKLRNESSNVFSAVCEMNWYELKPKESRTLLLIMYNSKLPMNITVGKFSALSLEYFVKILKTACGYLSMLLAVKSR